MDDNNNTLNSFTDVELLPTEILLFIFYWVSDFTDWRNILLVCKRFYHIISKEVNGRTVMIHEKQDQKDYYTKLRLFILPSGHCCIHYHRPLLNWYIHMHILLERGRLDGPTLVSMGKSATKYYGSYSNGCKHGEFITMDGNQMQEYFEYSMGNLDGRHLKEYNEFTIDGMVFDGFFNGNVKFSWHSPGHYSGKLIECTYSSGKLCDSIKITDCDEFFRPLWDNFTVYKIEGEFINVNVDNGTVNEIPVNKEIHLFTPYVFLTNLDKYINQSLTDSFSNGKPPPLDYPQYHLLMSIRYKVMSFLHGTGLVKKMGNFCYVNQNYDKTQRFETMNPHYIGKLMVTYNVSIESAVSALLRSYDNYTDAAESFVQFFH
jgi:hypothetical protein